MKPTLNPELLTVNRLPGILQTDTSGARPCKEKVYRQALSRCQVSCEPAPYDECRGESLTHIVCLACAHDSYGGVPDVGVLVIRILLSRVLY